MFITFLQANANLFAWQTSYMPGIPREVIENKLAIKEKIKRLTKVGFIREVVKQKF